MVEKGYAETDKTDTTPNVQLFTGLKHALDLRTVARRRALSIIALCLVSLSFGVFSFFWKALSPT